MLGVVNKPRENTLDSGEEDLVKTYKYIIAKMRSFKQKEDRREIYLYFN